MALTWWYVLGITLLATLIFIVLGQTKLGMMINTFIFMILIAVTLIVVKLIGDAKLNLKNY